jgi:hypothetical protein
MRAWPRAIQDARDALAQAVELTAAISAVILLALAVVAAILLRRVGLGAASEGPPAPAPVDTPAGGVGVE